MIELTLPFILSQVLVAFAMISDFLSFQFKKRGPLLLCMLISACLISAHYFLLSRIAAGVIVAISILRFIVSYHTTNKRIMIGFILLNTISLFFTYQSAIDLILYLGVCGFIIGNFQTDNKRMRQIMMLGTSLIVIYNAVILDPVGAIMEGSFLTSNVIGYYRYYGRKGSKKTSRPEKKPRILE